MKKTCTLLLATFYFFAAQAQWSLTGNAGTTPGTNFLGTTDGNKLIFKVNNQQSGLIDYLNTAGNTALGYQTLLANTGVLNVAFGYLALSSNSSASANSAFGSQALLSNTTGHNNHAFGTSSLYNNTTGNYNTAVGSALLNNTTGSFNTAFGHQALNANTTVSGLTAVGFEALYFNTSGTGNTAHGYQALYSNTTGSTNTALGDSALFSNTTGGNSTAIGNNALKSSNSTGVAGRVENTAVGESALTATTTGYGNTGLGTSALISNTTGSFNIAVGDAALPTNLTGNDNIAIGGDADVSLTNLNNATAIGFGALSNASNKMWLGNSSLTSLTCVVALTVVSDGRFKKNIQENVPGLEFINQLRPVTYTLDLTGMNKFLRPNPSQAKIGRSGIASAIETAAIDQGEQVVHTGFVAQEVEAAAKKLSYNFGGVDAPKNSNDTYGLRYSEFVVPLVKAAQQLSNKNDSLQQMVNGLQSQIDDLRQQINLRTRNVMSLSNDPAALKQNVPNPFNSNTVISYYIPSGAGSAQIVISDVNGQNLRNVAIGGKGAGQLTIAASTLAAGNYIYSLVIDGKKSIVSRWYY